RANVRRHQSRRRHHLFVARSSRSSRGAISMSLADPAVPSIEDAPPSKDAVQTPLRRFLADFFESRIAPVAVTILATLIVLAIIAPWIVPQNPYDLAQVDVLDSRLPPGERSSTGYTFWLGTDGAGRDLLSAMLYGLRISLAVGVMSGFIAMALGA